MNKYSAIGFGRRLLDFHIQELKTVIDEPDGESFRNIIGLLEDGQFDTDCCSNLCVALCNQFGFGSGPIEQWIDETTEVLPGETARKTYLQFILDELESCRTRLAGESIVKTP